MATKRKSTYELAPDVKLALASWRAQLRSIDVNASEKSIIEVLVRSTDVHKVGDLLRADTGEPTLVAEFAVSPPVRAELLEGPKTDKTAVAKP